MTESGADLGLQENHGSIYGEAAADPHQGNGRHAANGHSKMSAAKEKSKSPASNPRLKASRSNFTVPQPFSLTTEKRASKIQSPGLNGGTPPPNTQKCASKKIESPAYKSHGSSPAAGVTPRSKAEFVFRSDERAQKRMEFYATLSEKSKAREAERNRIQASNQQQMAAEIKKLRKDQTFKATPMPRFYQEPAPVRIDVKKTPPTRPKSPKLGRRASAAGEAPKIIARRSSDEYDISKLPAEDLKPATPTISSEPPRAPTTTDESIIPPPPAAIIPELREDGSEHSGSRKSDALPIPKAALSDLDEHEEEILSTPELALPPRDEHQKEYEEEGYDDSPPEYPRSGPESSTPAGKAAQPGIMQLPVSSSLLDDNAEDDDDDDVGEEEGGSEFGEEEEDEVGDDSPSPMGGGDDDEEGQENVRVYISEEFRLAASSKSHESEGL